tara:strand:- start:1319 stop:1999 length:681 start_codon:yes stop_codon:yes gene_type:complete
MKINNYWKSYKKKNLNRWHFNPLKKNTKDYLYIGNINANYSYIEKKIQKLEKKIKVSSVVKSDKKLKKANLHNRINTFREWGYNKFQTEYVQIFSDQYPSLFKKFIKVSKLSHATSSLIKQYPGNIIPWHYDTHITFKNKIKSNKNLKGKKILRYMVFLTNWDWGHYFCVGNNVVHQWKAGDIITWDPLIHHCGSNAGMSPKITLNITGFVEKDSIHLNKKSYFSI